MGEVVIAPGARGGLVRHLQEVLEDSGVTPDGLYGLQTAAAASQVQGQKGLPVTGEADPITWTTITGDPLPPLLERALQITAAFEGHGFGLAQGNFDGAGITWASSGSPSSTANSAASSVRRTARIPRSFKVPSAPTPTNSSDDSQPF